MLKNKYAKKMAEETRNPLSPIDGLTDEEKARWTETVKAIQGDAQGFLAAALLATVRDEAFRNKVLDSGRRLAIKEAAAVLAPCDELTKLPHDTLMVLLELPYEELSKLRDAARIFQNRGMALSDEMVKETIDLATVMHVLEEGLVKDDEGDEDLLDTMLKDESTPDNRLNAMWDHHVTVGMAASKS